MHNIACSGPARVKPATSETLHLNHCTDQPTTNQGVTPTATLHWLIDWLTRLVTRNKRTCIKKRKKNTATRQNQRKYAKLYILKQTSRDKWFTIDIIFILWKFILMSFMPKICRTFLYIGQDTVDTMFWMLKCCKKSAVSNFHYLFYRQKLITKAVSKGWHQRQQNKYKIWHSSTSELCPRCHLATGLIMGVLLLSRNRWEIEIFLQLIPKNEEKRWTFGNFWNMDFLHTRCPSCCPTNSIKALERSIRITAIK